MADDRTHDDIAAEAREDVGELIDRWVPDFGQGASGHGTSPATDFLEAGLVEPDGKSRNVLLLLVSDALSGIDEREAIAAKRET